MDFCIADTFTYSLVELAGAEQRPVKTTAFDLKLNPAHPRMSLHKLDQAKDKNFWSVALNAATAMSAVPASAFCRRHASRPLMSSRH